LHSCPALVSNQTCRAPPPCVAGAHCIPRTPSLAAETDSPNTRSRMASPRAAPGQPPTEPTVQILRLCWPCIGQHLHTKTLLAKGRDYSKACSRSPCRATSTVMQWSPEVLFIGRRPSRALHCARVEGMQGRALPKPCSPQRPGGSGCPANSAPGGSSSWMRTGEGWMQARSRGWGMCCGAPCCSAAPALRPGLAGVRPLWPPMPSRKAW
jgi:hypothetical protein